MTLLRVPSLRHFARRRKYLRATRNCSGAAPAVLRRLARPRTSPGGNGDASALLHAQWRVDPEPAVDIGSADGADEYLFMGPFATRLRDGRFVVADRYNADLRVFGAEGKFIARVGR